MRIKEFNVLYIKTNSNEDVKAVLLEELLDTIYKLEVNREKVYGLFSHDYAQRWNILKQKIKNAMKQEVKKNEKSNVKPGIKKRNIQI